MELVGVFVFVVLSVYGLYYAGLSGWWYVHSLPARAKVIGFHKRKSMGRAMPIVTFHDRDEIAVKAAIEATDHVGYMMSGAQEENLIPIRYAKDNPKKAKISGMFSFIVGGIMQVPLISTLVQSTDNWVIQEQYAFFMTVVAILGAAWVVLRFIRLNY